MKVIINPNVLLTRAQASATSASYNWTGVYRNGKLVFQVLTGKVLSYNSKFIHKKLCDAPTFTLGLSCPFSCSFCYLGPQLSRHCVILRIQQETGLLCDQKAVEKENPMPVLTRELVKLEGTAKYTTPHDARVVFASPLVDVAANIPKALPNIEDCKLILRHRHWQVRLLSKSALLQSVAAGGQIRWIASFTASARRHLTTAWRRVSRPAHRDLRTLAGVTFAPGQRLPHIRYDLSEPAEDYGAFVSHAAEAVRLDHCEHVWAEALNGRGESLRCITAALRTGADEKEAFALERVSSERLAWEEYACATFLAHSNVEPPEKLRFLQYVQPGPTELAAGTRSPGRCCWATMLFQPNRQTRRMIISHPFCRLTRHRWCTRMERPWRVVDSKETEKRDNNKQTDEL